MKQLLFLLLFPCLAMAQYPANGNQKITLGEQTSADGLVYRGNAADTVAATLKITKTNKLDTSAFLLLDTINNVFLKYNIGTTFWTRLNILPTDTASMLGNYWRSGRFSGVLPLLNGGTGSATQNFVDLTTTQSIGGAKTFTSALSGTSATFTATNNPLILKGTNSGTMWTEYYYNTNTPLGYIGSGSGILGGGNASDFIFRSESDFVVANGNSRNLTIKNTGNVGIGTASPNHKLEVNGNISTTSKTNYIVFGGDPNVNPFFQGTSTNDFALGTSNLGRLQVKSTGEIVIINLAGSGDRTVIADVNGVLSAPVSSITTKENVQILNYGLNEILKINPVSFDYINKDKWGEERKLGFIVEDIFSIVPEVTGTMNDGDLYLDMNKLIPILTKAIQEQQALIKTLEQRLLILENK